MSTKRNEKGTSRRGFLQASAAASAVLAAHLWLPRRARASAPAPVKRVIVVNGYGGVRWNATFDGQPMPAQNPWGLANDPTKGAWNAAIASQLGGVKAPTWGFSRMLLQKPLAMNASTKDWPSVLAHLGSDAYYNLARPALPLWGGAQLGNMADLAGSIAVVRNSQNPGGQFDGDHASAQHTLMTGKRSGQIGVVTAMQYGLMQALGPAAFQNFYPLPAVSLAAATWSLGIDKYAGARPVFLSSATALPTVDPGKSVAAWGRAAEQIVDGDYQLDRQAYMGQSVADFVNDKAAGDLHVSQLVDPSLHLSVLPKVGGSPAYGTTTAGAPVTNDMLDQCFGLSSVNAIAGDPLFDVFAALNNTTASAATWSLTQNSFGLAGALAVRLLQWGSPIVSLGLGNFDTHSYEVVDPLNKRTHPTQVGMLARVLTGLELALQQIADPQDPKASLWDSTVIFVCSEFGRGDNNVATGFNTPDGANDGGSGHFPQAGWPVLGGPVAAGGKLITQTGGGYLPQSSIYTTILKGMGADTVGGSGGGYLVESDYPIIPGLLAGVA
jgi:hypothetical protein